MTKTELRELIQSSGKSQAAFAAQLGVAPQTVRRWLTTKKTAIQPPRWLALVARRAI